MRAPALLSFCLLTLVLASPSSPAAEPSCADRLRLLKDRPSLNPELPRSLYPVRTALQALERENVLLTASMEAELRRIKTSERALSTAPGAASDPAIRARLEAVRSLEATVSQRQLEQRIRFEQDRARLYRELAARISERPYRSDAETLEASHALQKASESELAIQDLEERKRLLQSSKLDYP